ncbi:MAG: isoprenyl transferase [Oscillospiraceae bacterium]|nr:isoprenyl transferase [Oscillospiraceae bacterium]
MAKDMKKFDLPEVLPDHIGFIMDGNGRWAKKRFLPRKLGHVEGAKTFKKIVRYCRDIGVKCISFYAFSTENWKRPNDEVDAIMNLFRQYIDEAREHFLEETRIVFLGDKSVLAEDIREKMIAIEEDTRHFDKMTLLLAINYGGRDEIVHATKLLAEKVKSGELNSEDITEEMFSDHLYAGEFPDVDLLIRPSGELRISNYMIWQCAYAEFYFSDVLWPDFLPEELNKALFDYAKRSRRFGGV